MEAVCTLGVGVRSAGFGVSFCRFELGGEPRFALVFSLVVFPPFVFPINPLGAGLPVGAAVSRSA